MKAPGRALFGPILVRDGDVKPTHHLRHLAAARAAIGMVEKGHYWCVIVEGRIRESKGMTCHQLAELMGSLGCSMAFNLDGGWTSAMVFMGKQLNQQIKVAYTTTPAPERSDGRGQDSLV